MIQYLPHILSGLALLGAAYNNITGRDRLMINTLWKWYTEERRHSEDCHEDLIRVRAALARNGIHVNLRSVPPDAEPAE